MHEERTVTQVGFTVYKEKRTENIRKEPLQTRKVRENIEKIGSEITNYRYQLIYLFFKIVVHQLTVPVPCCGQPAVMDSDLHIPDSVPKPVLLFNIRT